MTETELRRHYVSRCNGAFRDARFFIRNVGTFDLGTAGFFKAGIKGQWDVEGKLLRMPFAVPFEVECKNVKTPLTEQQIAWGKFLDTWNTPKLLIRALNGETSDQILGRWVEETRSFLHAISEKHRTAFTSQASRSAS